MSNTHKKSIVYLHGLGSSKTSADGMLACLDKEKFDIYALDLPGHNSTEYLPMTDINDLAKWIAFEILKLNLKSLSLIGHSLGGLITSSIVEQNLLSDKLERAVIWSSPFRGVAKRVNALYSAYSIISPRIKWARAVPIFIRIADKIGLHINSNDIDDIAKTHPYTFRDGLKLIENSSYTFKSNVPLLYVFGKPDPVVNVEAIEYINANKNANSDLLVVPFGGHLGTVEGHSKVNAHISEFLLRNYR